METTEAVGHGIGRVLIPVVLIVDPALQVALYRPWLIVVPPACDRPLEGDRLTMA